MMAYNCQTLVVQYMNDEWAKFRGHRGLGLASIVSKQSGAAMDVYFVIFCVNCFVNRLKNYAPKTSVYLEKFIHTMYQMSLFF